MRITISLVAGICLVLLIIVNCNKTAKEENSDNQIKQDTIPVSTLTVEPQDFLEYGEYYGNIQGIKEATIICYAGGNVEDISVKEGAYVKAGTSLANIDAERISAGYETAKLNEKITRDNHERLKKHLEAGNASQYQVDQAHLQWLNSKTQRIEAEKARKGALCITPINGIVTTRHIEPHKELAPGSPTFTITQLHKVKVQVGIPESELEGVREGNEAEISFSIYPGRAWKGRVHRITQEASKMSKTFQAIIHINNPKRVIKPGLTAYVKLTLVKKTNQIVIPTNAILTEGKENWVMVVENNTAVKKSIETGVTNKNQTIVTGGLDQGSALIIKGHHIVSDGSVLKVLN
jgi:RND family efflux transporter MFP subunit